MCAREEGSEPGAQPGTDYGKETIVKNAILQNFSGAIVQVVRNRAEAISFDSFGYVNGSVKALA